MKLLHFWSSPQSQRIRLALAYKGVEYQDMPVAYWDDETFFELGIARQVPVLQLDNNELLTDALDILWRIDELFPQAPMLRQGKIDAAAWQALLEWRENIAALLERLYAPIRVSYKDIGELDDCRQDYKANVAKQIGQSVEALANDRYSAYEQLAKQTHINQLAQHLAKNKFYMDEISIADMLITADLFPLQLLDGVSMPIDMLYYIKRVQEICGLELSEGLLVPAQAG
jgi:glutaredoxin 2